jgi:uncharacterized damage-inducible protein DinB
MSHPFVEANTASRRRLEAFVAGLSPEELRQETSFGWTVAALLAHLAYWDRRVLVLLRRWKEKGFDESPVDSDAINGALHALCHAIEPRKAIAVCLEAARETDAEIETVSDALVARIADGSTHFRLNRGLHRNDHLDQLEEVLGRVSDGRRS